jgi:uncharacterized protein (DUF433 family)
MTAAEDLLKRIAVDPNVCGGKPVVKGTRLPISIILGGLAEGMTSEEIVDHYPQVTADDVRATLAYAAVLAGENTWKFAV